MREELADLRERFDALGPGTDDDRESEFTARELEVIALLPSSLTSREIAEELFLSWNTIKTHMRRAYRKLNASSREEAVLIADGLGLLPDQANSADRSPSSAS